MSGYFAWVRCNGRVSCEKFHAWRSDVQKETARRFECATVGKIIPLNDDEFELSLEQLAAKYPCPE